tara:strand:+ start:9743 stop:10030 length:288 start_codon:yes stop_codon:yes gene_type:complete
MNIQTQAARNTDPITSHEAATEITESGERRTQVKRVVEMVEENQGRTAAELAVVNNVCRYMLARRLADATDIYVMKGDKRKCSVAGRNAVTWWIK